jgi:apolipoprotein D and lipocalin family protein
MMKVLSLLSVGLLVSSVAHSQTNWLNHAPEKDGAVKVVENVDIEKYLGRWFEIARYETSFQKDCDFVTATYSPLDDGEVRVLNQCRRDGAYSELDSAKGKAWIKDTKSNAKLKVQFFWPFSGDYWIMELDEEYNLAVVGHPKRKFLWILSREPKISQELYDEIIDRIESQGYDSSKLRKTAQPSFSI